eukprot:701032-Prorocentrum_minimum.AAC.1
MEVFPFIMKATSMKATSMKATSDLEAVRHNFHRDKIGTETERRNKWRKNDTWGCDDQPINANTLHPYAHACTSITHVTHAYTCKRRTVQSVNNSRVVRLVTVEGTVASLSVGTSCRAVFGLNYFSNKRREYYHGHFPLVVPNIEAPPPPQAPRTSTLLSSIHKAVIDGLTKEESAILAGDTEQAVLVFTWWALSLEFAATLLYTSSIRALNCSKLL